MNVVVLLETDLFLSYFVEDFATYTSLLVVTFYSTGDVMANAESKQQLERMNQKHRRRE